MAKRLTHEEFVNNLKALHPNLEVLSLYNGDKKYITVKCLIHDYVFKTKPNWLKQNHGCQKCYDERRSINQRKTTEQFIIEAQKVHGNEYVYSKVNYKNNSTKVCIICLEHGEFWQTPNKHLNGQGCPKCAIKKNGLNRRLTQEEFEKKANNIHLNKYIYHNDYQGCDKDILITCRIHGDFKQNAYIHLNGSGCPKCNQSKLELQVETYLKEHNINYISQYEITTNKRKQYLDFYLPNLNIAIECQGGQHFFSTEHFGGETEFVKIKERDERKYNYCLNNNIKLIYIYDSKLKNTIQQLIESQNSIYNANNIIELNHLGKIFS